MLGNYLAGIQFDSLNNSFTRYVRKQDSVLIFLEWINMGCNFNKKKKSVTCEAPPVEEQSSEGFWTVLPNLFLFLAHLLF